MYEESKWSSMQTIYYSFFFFIIKLESLLRCYVVICPLHCDY